MSDGIIREQQLRDRVRAAKFIASDPHTPRGERAWARMYAQDVEPIRRALSFYAIAHTATLLRDRPTINSEPLRTALARARRLLGAKR